MSLLDTIAEKIIKEQELVIGPLAWSEAGKVQGLTVNVQTGEATISNGDPKAAVDRLVAQYERLFGRASQELCKEAVLSITADLPRNEVPASLLA